MDKKTTSQLKPIIKRLSKFPKVSSIFLFGSNVTDRARKDSDVDIAVLTKNATDDEEFEIIGCSNRIFDVSVMSRLPLVIQFRVIKEGKLLFCKDELYLTRAKSNILRNYLDFSVFINRFYKRTIENV